MNLLCKIFGHQPPVYAKKGWYSPGEEYANVRVQETDGIGRIHAHVEAECARCNKVFRIARIHLPQTEKRPLKCSEIFTTARINLPLTERQPLPQIDPKVFTDIVEGRLVIVPKE